MTAVPGTISGLAGLRVGRVRGALRLLAIPLFTAACWLAWLVAGLGPDGGTRREAMVRRWARGIMRVLHFEVERVGRAPERPFLLVANHLSYLDVVVLMTLLDAVFVSKYEVRRWPILGPLAQVVGTIFIDRDSPRDALRVGTEMSRAIAGGRGVVLFAEGTSSDGSRVLPLRPALLHGAARDGLPVHVASLSYHTDPVDPHAGQALCWWGDMTFLPHLAGVCRLGRARARVVFGAHPVVANDRRVLADTLHGELTRTFISSGHAH